MKERKKVQEIQKLFTPVQSTSEYTERTYYTMKDYAAEASSLISPTLFWSELAKFFLIGGQKDFLSSSFMQLVSGIDFILASCFISN
jgi:hypothetical protein